MKCFILFILCLSPFYSKSQTLEPSAGNVGQIFGTYKEALLDKNKLVWGFSLGATIDLGAKRNSALRLFVSGAIAKTLTNNDVVDALATVQSEIEFYRGGLGSSVLNDERYKINIEMRTYPQIVLGFDFDNRMIGRPMSLSIGQSMSTLYDPFDASLSLGSSFINGINHRRNQQVGYIIGGYRNFQAYYANDGPFFGGIGLGDRFDRWWTGAAQVALFFLNDNGFVTDFGIRYDRFTGYQPHLYELAKTLQIDNLPYKKTKEQYFNQGRFQLRVGLQNISHLTFSIYNPNWNDVQDRIHYITGAPYHIKLMDRFWTLGMDFQYKNIKIIN